jgi:hypothetical protein
LDTGLLEAAQKGFVEQSARFDFPLELFENDELFGLIVNPGGYLRD